MRLWAETKQRQKGHPTPTPCRGSTPSTPARRGEPILLSSEPEDPPEPVPTRAWKEVQMFLDEAAGWGQLPGAPPL